MKKNYLVAIAFAIALVFASCSSNSNDRITIPNGKEVGGKEKDPYYLGFYLLNEGQMDKNNASLDFYNYTSGFYTTNIYPEINPLVVKELGDIGNDLKIHKHKMYAVINLSHKIEIMAAGTAEHLGQIDINNPRRITFDGNMAYVSTANPYTSESQSQLDAIFEFDTNTMKLTGRKVHTGRSPEGVLVHSGKLYVANSGGQDYPNFDNTVSVVNLESFEVEEIIEVGLNPSRLFIDNKDRLYVIIEGNYGTVQPRMDIIDTKDYSVSSVNLPISNLAIVGDIAYFYSNIYSLTEILGTSYGIFNLDTQSVEGSYMPEEYVKEIIQPYAIAANEANGDVFIADGVSFGANGIIYCFNKEAKLKWKTEVGVGPANIAFYKKD